MDKGELTENIQFLPGTLMYPVIDDVDRMTFSKRQLRFKKRKTISLNKIHLFFFKNKNPLLYIKSTN